MSCLVFSFIFSYFDCFWPRLIFFGIFIYIFTNARSSVSFPVALASGRNTCLIFFYLVLIILLPQLVYFHPLYRHFVCLILHMLLPLLDKSLHFSSFLVPSFVLWHASLFTLFTVGSACISGCLAPLCIHSLLCVWGFVLLVTRITTLPSQL